MPRWRAGSSPGAALVERGIDGAADGIGLRREPAAVGRASRSLSGTERRRSAPCPRRQGGGRARASCSEAREPVLPEASQRRAAALRRGRLDAPGRAAAGSALPPRVPTRSVIPARVPGTPSAGSPQPAASRGRFAPSAGAGSLFSPALQGGRLCCKQEPAHYINIIYPTVQKPSGCLPFPQRHLPASAPRALLPRTLQTAEPQRRYLQRIPANLNSPCPTRPSGK